MYYIIPMAVKLGLPVQLKEDLGLLKIWRTICGPTYDNINTTCRRKYNKGLQDKLGIVSVIRFIRGQRIQYLGHAMWRSEDDISRTTLS